MTRNLLSAAEQAAVALAEALQAIAASECNKTDWREPAAAWLRRRCDEQRYPTFVLRAEAMRHLADELEHELKTQSGRALPQDTQLTI